MGITCRIFEVDILTHGISFLPVLKRLLPRGRDLKKYPIVVPRLHVRTSVDETIVFVSCTNSRGTGIVIDAASGIILTCSHCIPKGTSGIQVFRKGNIYPAGLVYKTTVKFIIDLAVIQVSPGSFVAHVELADTPAQSGMITSTLCGSESSPKDKNEFCFGVAIPATVFAPYVKKFIATEKRPIFEKYRILGQEISRLLASARFENVKDRDLKSELIKSRAKDTWDIRLLKQMHQYYSQDVTFNVPFVKKRVYVHEINENKKMENSLKLQMEVKNNAEDLRLYMLDLNNWEEEMKKKEKELKNTSSKVVDLPPPRNTVKRNSSEELEENKKFSEEEKKVKRIHAYDYSAWDKYDADKACAELDEESNGEKAKKTEIIKEEEEETKKQEQEREELVEETKSLKNIDEAFYEKQLGNLFVKKEKWEDAIKCYTKAIDLDSKNAIYYANRALCFVKLKNFKCAEVDATIAIQIDGTYVKAYQRRAVARKALGQHQEAILDYKQILKLDPKNTFANVEIKKLENLNKPCPKTEDKKPVKPIFDPKIIFKNEPKTGSKEVLSKKGNTENVAEKMVKQKGKVSQFSEVSGTEENIIKDITHAVEKSDLKMQDCLGVKKSIFGEVPPGFTVVNPIHIPPHLRSKEPLRRIPIKEIFTNGENFDEFINLSNSIACDSQEIAPENEKKAQNVLSTKIEEKQSDLENLHFPVPATCVQFLQAWKYVKNNVKCAYSYLKKINLDNLPSIFRYSLESDLFSELISSLADDYFLADYNFVYSFLYNLSKVQRFGSLLLFMSSSDNENLSKCVARLEEKKPREEIEDLCNLYELSRKIWMPISGSSEATMSDVFHEDTFLNHRGS